MKSEKSLAACPQAPWWEHHFWPLVSVVLLVPCLLGVDAARRFSPTHDEYWHLPLGLWAWQTGEQNVDPINPPLVRQWAALPLFLGGARIESRNITSPQPSAYDIADAFLLTDQAHALEWYFWGRLGLLPGLWIGGMVTAWWARQWWGSGSGLMAAVLWACCPNLLANAAIVAHDFPLTLVTLLACAVVVRLQQFSQQRPPSDPRSPTSLQSQQRPDVVRQSQRGIWWWWGLLGVLLGIAQLCKLSGVLLYAICPLLWIVLDPAACWPSGRCLSGSPGWERRSVLSFTSQILLAVGLSWLVLQLGYGQFMFGNPPTHLVDWLLPAGYRDGWRALQAVMAAAHPVYLDQEWRGQGGFRDYYLRALAYKLPLGTLLLLLLAGLRTWRLRRNPVELCRSLSLWALVAVWLIPASLSGNQLGLRYVLPAIPFLLIGAASAVSGWLESPAPRFRLCFGLLLLCLPWSLRQHPDHLAYFNRATGGPDTGWRHLIDSNIDWGQDLQRLATELPRLQRELGGDSGTSGPLGLAYFGAVPPSAVGIDYRFPPSRSPEPGLYAISVSFLAGRPHHLRDIDGRSLVAGMDEFGYFRFFEPVEKIGQSIAIFQLTPEDVARFHAARTAAERGE